MKCSCGCHTDKEHTKNDICMSCTCDYYKIINHSKPNTITLEEFMI